MSILLHSIVLTLQRGLKILVHVFMSILEHKFYELWPFLFSGLIDLHFRYLTLPHPTSWIPEKLTFRSVTENEIRGIR